MPQLRHSRMLSVSWFQGRDDCSSSGDHDVIKENETATSRPKPAGAGAQTSSANKVGLSRGSVRNEHRAHDCSADLLRFILLLTRVEPKATVAQSEKWLTAYGQGSI
jgi:hypothetical protein